MSSYYFNYNQCDRISLEVYLKEIRKNKSLSKEREFELFKKIEKGDKFAVDELINANLKFVITAARTYGNYGIPLNDLINEGNMGLLRAVKTFDITRNCKFFTHASHWIHQAIKAYINDTLRTVRVPRSVIAEYSKLSKAKQKMLAEKGYIDEEELIATTGLTIRRMEENTIHMERSISFDSPISIDDNTTTIVDQFADVDCFKYDDNIIRLKHISRFCLSKLPERNREIVKDYFGIDRESSLCSEVICEKYKLTGMRINQIITDALIMMKAHAQLKNLTTFK